MVYPADESEKNLFLRLHVQVVVVEKLFQDAVGKMEKFVLFYDFDKLADDEPVGLLEQLGARVEVGELLDSQTVGRVHVVAEEGATRRLQLAELEDPGRREEILDVVDGHHDLSRVGVVDQRRHCPRLDVLELDLGQRALSHATREHGSEVGADARHDDPVGRQGLVADSERNVAELAFSTELIHHQEGLVAVFLHLKETRVGRRRLVLRTLNGILSVTSHGCFSHRQGLRQEHRQRFSVGRQDTNLCFG